MWLKRAIAKPESKWVDILDATINDIRFINLIDSKISQTLLARLPQFYVDTLGIWKKIRHINDNTEGVKAQLLWYNDNITIDKKPYFWKTWYSKGILRIADILDINGSFLSHEELQRVYNVNCSFMQMLQIRLSIPLLWREVINNKSKNEFNEAFFIFGNNDTWISLQKADSKQLYWSQVFATQNKTPACIAKWEESLGYISSIDEWQTAFKLPFKCCEETFLQSFQYRIIHRIFSCNHWLNTMKVLNSPLCQYCKLDDTICHYFVHCKLVQSFWDSLAIWWSNLFISMLELNNEIIIFGVNITTKETRLLNYILIFAKWYIFVRKSSGTLKDVDFYQFLTKVKERLVYKRCVKKIQGNIQQFDLLWGEIYFNI